MGQTAKPTIGKRFGDRRRVFAILAASGFLVGAVGDTRPCPHHEPLAAQYSNHGGSDDERGHTEAYRRDHHHLLSFSAGYYKIEAGLDAHECLCIDFCSVDPSSAVSTSESEAAAPVGVLGASPVLAERDFHPRPTAVLIPLPNAPPKLA